MDDLLREFLTETNESLDTVDNQLVRFEQDPNNAKILDNVFRLVHTIKGTCGFLGLPRLEALAHAGETLMSKFRDGMPVTAEAVTLILSSIDRIKEILGVLEATETEPEGTDPRRHSNANCVPAKCRWMSWSAPSARPQPRSLRSRRRRLRPHPRRTPRRPLPLRKNRRQPNRSLRSKCWKPTKSPTSRSASMWTRWNI